MNLYEKRRRARRLNGPDAATVEKRDDDAGNLDDLDLDYSGIASSVHGDPEDDRERRLRFAKSLGEDEDAEDEVAKAVRSHRIFGGDDVDLDDLGPISYEGINKSDEEREREALVQNLADELERRGAFSTDDDGATGGVSKATDEEDGVDLQEQVEKDLRAASDLRESVEEYRRQQQVEDKREEFVADGGDPDATLDEFQDWLQNAA